MARWDEISPATIVHIAWDVREGNADPEDARRVLEYFCELVAERAGIRTALLQHLAYGFRSYLKGERTFEAAFGIVRAKRGRRSAAEVDEHRVNSIARDVLSQLLQGNSLDAAAAIVSKTRHLGETQVREYWRLHKHEALKLERASRPHDCYPWTQDELGRMKKIYRKELMTGDKERDYREGRWLWLGGSGLGKPLPRAGKFME